MEKTIVYEQMKTNGAVFKDSTSELTIIDLPRMWSQITISVCFIIPRIVKEGVKEDLRKIGLVWVCCPLLYTQFQTKICEFARASLLRSRF